MQLFSGKLFVPTQGNENILMIIFQILLMQGSFYLTSSIILYLLAISFRVHTHPGQIFSRGTFDLSSATYYPIISILWYIIEIPVMTIISMIIVEKAFKIWEGA
jgi:hypothetical protein